MKLAEKMATFDPRDKFEVSGPLLGKARLLMDLMQYRTPAKPMSRTELTELVDIDTRSLRRLVAHLNLIGVNPITVPMAIANTAPHGNGMMPVPILPSDEGYYVARNADEVQPAVDYLLSYAMTLLMRIKALRHLFGPPQEQLTLDL
jgi:hypothetical protein